MKNPFAKIPIAAQAVLILLAFGAIYAAAFSWISVKSGEPLTIRLVVAEFSDGLIFCGIFLLIGYVIGLIVARSGRQ